MIEENRRDMSEEMIDVHLKNDTNNSKLIIAVTMATGLQGRGVVKELSKTNKFHIKAMTRNPYSVAAQELKKIKNVEVIKADLLNAKSLESCFEGVYGIFGNTTPTKGWQPFVRTYEMEQGQNLIDVVKKISRKGDLKHFIFSSVCKAKDLMLNKPAPGHFSSKWDIEEYLHNNELTTLSTIIRPVSYFENFDGSYPGLNINDSFFPGIVNPEKVWQTIAVSDVGRWASAIFSNPPKFLGRSINLAGEEMTGKEMVALLNKIKGKEEKEVKYKMIPRFILKFLIHDLGIMADWIERAGYGADLNFLTTLAKEEGIFMTSFESWLQEKVNARI